MKDCCSQEIVPIPGHKLEMHTNRHTNTDGTSWGWIDGCTKNICWSNNSGFNSAAAGKFVKEHNEKLTEGNV